MHNLIRKRPSLYALFFVVSLSYAHAQIVISNADMFGTPGESFLADYRETPDKDIGFNVNPDLFGDKGGPRSWNLDSLPFEDVYRFDYLSLSQGGTNALLFPLANLIEQRTVESSNSHLWKYLKQAPGTGRQSFGFVQDDILGGIDRVSYGKPLLEIPEPLHYGDSWTAEIAFTNTVNTISMITHYASADTVDAFGTLYLPNLGALPCLRINEIGTWSVQVINPLNGQLIDYGTDYIRSYIWVVKGFGIAAQISSQGSLTVPPENFTSAFFIYRMFSTTRSENINVRSLSVVKHNAGFNLKWNPVNGASTYTVFYCTNFSPNVRWQVLGTTTDTNWEDSMDGPGKFYLVNWSP